MIARITLRERSNPTAKKSDSVYRIIDVVGVSEKSWEDAGRRTTLGLRFSFKYGS